jgi:hypothetical protein
MSRIEPKGVVFRQKRLVLVSFCLFFDQILLSRSSAASLIIGSQQPTANSQQPTANSQQPTANSQQPTANSQQPTANSQQPKLKTLTLNCRRKNADCGQGFFIAQI